VTERRPFHLLLLRHGETDANATGVLQGHQQNPLNARGLQQAQRLAARVARHRPRVTKLISSDLRRAVQTAEPVAAACGLAPTFDRAWRERGFGDLEGHTVGERDTWRAAHGDMDPPGAESVESFSARVVGAVNAVAQKYGTEPAVAVVTHGGPVGIILRALSDGALPLAQGHVPVEVVRAANCSVLELVRAVPGGPWRVACVNDVTHLEGLTTEADSG
jgi:broad specificity phosphatase PhoE